MSAQSFDKDAIRKMIEAAVASAGDQDPSTLPHRIRQRLEGQATGELDLDVYIKQILREMGRNA